MTPTPINEYHTLDALLVLGGEDQTYRPRSITAKMIYGAVTMRRAPKSARYFCEW